MQRQAVTLQRCGRVIGMLGEQLLEQSLGLVHLVQDVTAAGQTEQQFGRSLPQGMEPFVLAPSVPGSAHPVKSAGQSQAGLEAGV